MPLPQVCLPVPSVWLEPTAQPLALQYPQPAPSVLLAPMPQKLVPLCAPSVLLARMPQKLVPLCAPSALLGATEVALEFSILLL